MTDEAIGTVAAIALVFALYSGARAKWQTDADRKRTVSPKAGERWKLVGKTTVDIPESTFDQYASAMSATGIADVLSSGGPDRRTFEVELRYLKDTTLTLGVWRELAPGVSMELVTAEKLS